MNYLSNIKHLSLTSTPAPAGQIVVNIGEFILLCEQHNQVSIKLEDIDFKLLKQNQQYLINILQEEFEFYKDYEHLKDVINLIKVINEILQVLSCKKIFDTS